MSTSPRNWYELARPLLFALDAECAHDSTLRWLGCFGAKLLRERRAGRLGGLPKVSARSGAVRLMGLEFPNRFGLAAGLDKGARALSAWQALGFGFVEIGTVTPRPQPGNAIPRLFRLPADNALINRMGFNSEGLDVVLARVRRWRYSQAEQAEQIGQATQPPMLLGINLGKNASTPLEHAADDYVTGLAAATPLADYLCINISSPNTKGLRDLQSEAALDALLARLEQERQRLEASGLPRKPLLLKIAPDLDEAQLDVIATLLPRHRVDGVVATNTTLARDGLHDAAHAAQSGGLSGAPLRERANAILRGLRARLGRDYPIIGVGGVMHARDAQAKLEQGADLVQLYTGLIYRGPNLLRECLAA